MDARRTDSKRRRTRGRSVGVALLLLVGILLASAAEARGKARPHGLRLPFVANEGQFDPDVAYSARVAAATVFVTRRGEIVYSAPGCAAGSEFFLAEEFVEAAPVPEGAVAGHASVSYFLGNDPSRWTDRVPTFTDVSLGELWPGIAGTLKAHGDAVEKTFTVLPGADASRIRVRLRGARTARVAADGALEADPGGGAPLRFTAPVAYQEHGGVREEVAVAYWLDGDEYGFRLGLHDPQRAVVIDPILQSTFSGGSGTFDEPTEIAFHPVSGEVYVAGFGNSGAFPGVTGGSQASFGGPPDDGIVARYSADLTTLEQATYLGGSAYDIVEGLAISSSGDVYVVGETTSTNFPGTTGGAQASAAGLGDAFVVKLPASLTGTIQSTYLGGASADHGSRSVAVDPATGKVFVAGWGESKTFPGTAGGAQVTFTGSFSSWVVRLNAGLTAIEQSTFVGEVTQAFSMALTSAGVYVAGHNGIPPALTGGAQTVSSGTDAFVTLLPKSLTSFTRSTYFGGEGLDSCFGVAVNTTSGDVYITGGTSSLSLPGVSGGAQRVRQGPTDNYVARFNGALTTLLGATYNGGTGSEGANGIDVDSATGDVFIAGTTSSARLPGSTAGAQRIYGGGSLDAFAVRFNAALSSVLGGTFLGGGPDDPLHPFDSGDDEALSIRYNADRGEIYVIGYTSSSDFPKTAGGAQEARGGVPNDGGSDGFVTRLTPDLLALFAPVQIVVDPSAGATSDGDLVLEPGETVAVQPAWKNQTPSSATISGAASSFTGPAGATYTLADASAAYGTVSPGASKSCTGVPNCFALSVSAPATRPAPHWDVTFIETPTPDDAPMKWTLHVGDSFTDVPRSQPFYRKIETLLHYGVTLGCTATTFCLTDKVPRVNMAIFIARAIAGGAGSLPDRGSVGAATYSCTFATGVSLFTDVAPTDAACPAVHYLAALNVASGCSPGVFCTAPNVQRGDMAIFMARGVVAPAGGAGIPQTYGPDPGTGRSYSCNPGGPNLHFSDVGTADIFCKHVHFLWAKGLIDGCSATQYCPASDVTRDAMAKFLSNSFALNLYAP